MLLSEWYPLLSDCTVETRLLKLQQNPELSQQIQEVLDAWGQVFVRLDERSPKCFEPCSTRQQVFDCLEAPRTRALLATSQYLCLRRWISFDQLVEVRCFMHGGLTALCQNDAQSQSEPLDNAPGIKAAVIGFIASIAPRLPERCTVDVAVDRNLLVQVVEVNSSFLDQAGEGLWDLDNPADLFQLMHGHDHVRFRYYCDLFYGQNEC